MKEDVMRKDKSQKLVGIFILAIVLFNFPILELFVRGDKLGAIPIMIVYIFGTWIFIIILTYLTIRSNDNSAGKSSKK